MIDLNKKVEAKKSDEGLGFIYVPEGSYICKVTKVEEYKEEKKTFAAHKRDENGKKVWENNRPVKSTESKEHTYHEARIYFSIVSALNGATTVNGTDVNNNPISVEVEGAALGGRITTHQDWFDGADGYDKLLYGVFGEGANLSYSEAPQLKDKHLVVVVKDGFTNPKGDKFDTDSMGRKTPKENKKVTNIRTYKYDESAIKLNGTTNDVPAV